MHPVAGVRLGVASAGIKKPGRKDVVLIEACEGSRSAGVFTTNAFCAAPVTLCKRHLQTGNIRYLITNSGNANACTGEPGLEDALETCRRIGELAGVSAAQVLPYSTGVIGERLPMDRLLPALPAAYAALTESGWDDAARGIMTTDTRPKGASVQFEHDGVTVTVTGIAKGSGMIKPNMATMLGYIATDAGIDQTLLNALAVEACNLSFNRITVDGDTSTNDSCTLIATGRAALPDITDTQSALYQKLRDTVVAVHVDLAKAIVTDGEGATKFVTINVSGGATPDECVKVAYAVAHSPLIKTALFASDPNWGRIVAAIGYAGVDNLDANKVVVHLGDVLIVKDGGRAPTYTEEQGQAVMNEENITIHIDLGRGDYADRVWTTDLSHDYVTINADYRS
jgi:glutamate N-acetyltransferase/amino-acid N-acetyltransferase